MQLQAKRSEIYADFLFQSPHFFCCGAEGIRCERSIANERFLCYNGFMRTLSLTIDASLHDCTVKDVLTKRLFLSDSLCSKLKRRPGSVLLNEIPVYVTKHVQVNDVLTVQVGDVEKDPRLVPKSLPLSILYEDEDLIILNKPSGLSVHPARDPNEITLENALAAYLCGTDNPHPVSRLDRGTTGIMTIAKSGWAHSWMKTLQHTGGLKKTYLAICTGTPFPDHGQIATPIGCCEGSTYQRMIRPDGSPALSEYQVLQSKNGLSLVRLIPHTGRTHQLRVHMTSIGHPLLGDWLYGSRDDRIDRPALHAFQLSFRHPLTGKELSFTCPLPPDMTAIFPYREEEPID